MGRRPGPATTPARGGGASPRARPFLRGDRRADGDLRAGGSRQRLPRPQATEGADGMNATDLKRLAPAADAAFRSRRAAGGLGAAAADRGLLDVAVTTMGSPVGDLLIAVTPRGLARVAFDIEPRDDVLEEIAERVSPRILGSASATDAWRRELEEYFAPERIRFDLPI